MSKVIIADKYQCPHLDGEYLKENKILKRKGMKVTKEYVDRINGQDNGLLLIVDNEATRKNQEARELKNGVRNDQKQRASMGGGAMLDALISRAAGKVETKIIEPKAEKFGKPKLSDLREQYPDIKASSVDAFLLKIAELEPAKENINTGERMTSPPNEDDLL